MGYFLTGRLETAAELEYQEHPEFKANLGYISKTISKRTDRTRSTRLKTNSFQASDNR